MRLKDLKLPKAQREALESWRNFWGNVPWKEELRRLWDGEKSPLDELFDRDKLKALKDCQKKVEPILDRLVIGYTGPDRD